LLLIHEHPGLRLAAKSHNPERTCRWSGENRVIGQGDCNMPKKILVVNDSCIDRQFLLGLFSNGMTSALRRPSPALWQLSGGMLVERSSH